MQAQQKLEAAGWGVLRRQTSETTHEGWWVYVLNADAGSQARTLNAIRRAGISDAFAMPDDPEFRVSVGIFSEEDRAEDRAARVQKLKLDALVSERSRELAVFWFDVPGVAREPSATDGWPRPASCWTNCAWRPARRRRRSHPRQRRRL